MWKDELRKEWITDKVTLEAVDFAKDFGEDLAQGRDALTTSQLRRFFGEVKRQQMQSFDETRFAMLKPKLAYAVGRAKQKAGKGAHLKIEDFYDVLAKAVDFVLQAGEKEKARTNFVTLLEAIVAYHKSKAEGGL